MGDDAWQKTQVPRSEFSFAAFLRNKIGRHFTAGRLSRKINEVYLSWWMILIEIKLNVGFGIEKEKAFDKESNVKGARLSAKL